MLLPLNCTPWNYMFSKSSEVKEESPLHRFHFRLFVVLWSRCCYSAWQDQHVSVQPSKGGGQAEGEAKGETVCDLIIWDWTCSQMRWSGWCYDPLILTFSPQSGLLSTFSLSMTDLSKSCENLSTVMLYNPGWVYEFTDKQLHVIISSNPAVHLPSASKPPQDFTFKLIYIHAALTKRKYSGWDLTKCDSSS